MKFLQSAKAFLQAAGLVFGLRGGTEEPAYQTIAALGEVQLRRYAPRLAASVSVRGDEITARSKGFRLLAGYIFGANTASASLSMTAPVAQASAAIAMTAPVAQAQAADGAWVISFYMPSGYTLATLPRPLDPQISLHEVAETTEAVYRFPGRPKAAAVARARAILARQLAGSAWVAAGEPVAQFYDPPWTLPWLRRNEVTVAVMPKS
ncbi:SOUL heme-binding protein [Acidocella aquatica]|uniref:SOUL heme-binding protein n=1 Tax=Acidocella aquatica TaxID=1922313 RepID=A0ABQ6ABT0_9PROT|nr:heme-binding protein [Acidocella aquatica]GLR67544.1 SOUL heme-binding protein [Acidocella aquatica]